MFADAAQHDTAFARELPRFLAAIWRVFNEYEIAGYVAMQKPTARRQLRALLYFVTPGCTLVLSMAPLSTDLTRLSEDVLIDLKSHEPDVVTRRQR